MIITDVTALFVKEKAQSQQQWIRKIWKQLRVQKKLNFTNSIQKLQSIFFCSVCGINTHNLRRSDPNTYGVNVGCLEDISTKELFELNVRVNDGKNHRMDRMEK